MEKIYILCIKHPQKSDENKEIRNAFNVIFWQWVMIATSTLVTKIILAGQCFSYSFQESGMYSMKRFSCYGEKKKLTFSQTKKGRWTSQPVLNNKHSATLHKNLKWQLKGKWFNYFQYIFQIFLKVFWYKKKKNWTQNIFMTKQIKQKKKWQNRRTRVQLTIFHYYYAQSAVRWERLLKIWMIKIRGSLPTWTLMLFTQTRGRHNDTGD